MAASLVGIAANACTEMVGPRHGLHGAWLQKQVAGMSDGPQSAITPAYATRTKEIFCPYIQAQPALC